MVLTSPTMSRRHVSWVDYYLKASEELRSAASVITAQFRLNEPELPISRAGPPLDRLQIGG